MPTAINFSLAAATSVPPMNAASTGFLPLCAAPSFSASSSGRVMFCGVTTTTIASIFSSSCMTSNALA